MTDPVAQLHLAVEEAASAIADGGLGARPTLERPKQAGHGDYSTNVAMLLAPAAGAPPREVAEQVGAMLRERLGAALTDVQVAGPGFLNLVLADGWYGQALSHVLEAGERFGAVAPTGETALVEFVSANPTGPLTAASGRHAAYGDAVARLLELTGYDVSREYYFNDAGSQIMNLGLSIQARARGEEPPEDGYQGDYVRELAAQIPGAADAPPEDLAAQGVAVLIERIRATLHDYRVDFDSWFSEARLHPEGIAKAIERVAEHTYRHDNALWLRTTTWGDDKDRVLLRSTGEPTYFAADVAYTLDKLQRGYALMINVLGSDHHGYVGRLKAIMSALGEDPDRYDVRILQFVHLVEGASRAGMSKRRGEFVTLDELISEIGVDATRWYMLARSHDSTIDLDLELARKESAENSVYYVQYAHARIASVLAKAGEERVAAALAATGDAVEGPLEPAERALVKKLLAFPGEVAEAAAKRAPHRIAAYALDLAQEFTAFYRDCRVVGAEPEALESFRIALSVATQRTLARSLDLLGVSAPESMRRDSEPE
ncbi:MAG: arginyl-tRNA synthetase [Solirubrobacteraceae bacterium]|nr:arginyl-tRNA synthetase [Solirubrobacteraceae bacterium]